MSANKTRLLFADDTDLLARARSGIVDRPEFDVVMASSTDEAMRLAADAPLGAVVLPADGLIDGLQVCRSLKSASNGNTVVILALSADDTAKRDACFAAGADDVLFAPIDAGDVVMRLDRAGAAFRTAPRAEVELVVRIASPASSAVLDAAGMQISREAIQVRLPEGMPPPSAGLLLRVVFTLYEGGTLQVWARATAPDPGRTVLRFVGLSEPERRAIDYFVDFYLKRAQPAAAPDAQNGHAAEPDELLLSDDDPAPSTSSGPGASVEELILSASVPDAPPAASIATIASKNELVRQIAEASLDEIADAAALFAAGRDGKLPPGFDSSRVRGWLPKLTPTETSALRGTTMYNNLLGDLRGSAAARIRLIEMTIVLRDGGTRLDKNNAEQGVMSAITEAQQIHNALDSGFQELLKAGNAGAMRDLGPVKVGLLSACVDLKNTFDRDVLGKEVSSPGAKGPSRPTQSRYATDPAAIPGPAKGEPRESRPERATRDSKESKEQKRQREARSRRTKNVATAIVLVVLLFGGAWTNRRLFFPRPPPVFHGPNGLFVSNDIGVWMSRVDRDNGVITWIVDGTYYQASGDAQTKLFEDVVSRSKGAGHRSVRLMDYRGKVLATRPLT